MRVAYPYAPVDCIRPTPQDADFATAEMLYIDPAICIDCGACLDECPVNAIYLDDDLDDALAPYKGINAEYFENRPITTAFDRTSIEQHDYVTTTEPLRIAIVGAGAAASYSTQELLRRTSTEVSIFEKLPTPWGLIRSGVAPDHAATKDIVNTFELSFADGDVHLYFNVEVGQHISHEELLAHHHAVIYAVGASADRRLAIPGEDLPGSRAASEFVAWYNGHPGYAEDSFDLSGERAVIIGNGNVALDIARILTADPDTLAKTDIAEHALADSALEGRGPTASLKVALARTYANRERLRSRKRIVLKFLVSPQAIVGGQHVTGVDVMRNEAFHDGGTVRATGVSEIVPAALVLRSIGYQGRAIPGLPFDDARGVVPNHGGRVVLADGTVLPKVYVSGWIKRGPRGVIGSNKMDARETVDHLLEDIRLRGPQSALDDRNSLESLLASRQPAIVDRHGWRAIDQAERAKGLIQGRPRVKLTDVASLVDAATGEPECGVRTEPNRCRIKEFTPYICRARYSGDRGYRTPRISERKVQP